MERLTFGIWSNVILITVVASRKKKKMSLNTFSRNLGGTLESQDPVWNVVWTHEYAFAGGGQMTAGVVPQVSSIYLRQGLSLPEDLAMRPRWLVSKHQMFTHLCLPSTRTAGTHRHAWLSPPHLRPAGSRDWTEVFILPRQAPKNYLSPTLEYSLTMLPFKFSFYAREDVRDWLLELKLNPGFSPSFASFQNLFRVHCFFSPTWFSKTNREWSKKH